MSDIRPIDANALKEQFADIRPDFPKFHQFSFVSTEEIARKIDNAPTVEEVSVIEFKEPLPLVKAQKIVKVLSKRPQGEWQVTLHKSLTGTWNRWYEYKCSNCKRSFVKDRDVYEGAKFCPNCGTKMQLKDKEGKLKIE